MKLAGASLIYNDHDAVSGGLYPSVAGKGSRLSLDETMRADSDTVLVLDTHRGETPFYRGLNPKLPNDFVPLPQDGRVARRDGSNFSIEFINKTKVTYSGAFSADPARRLLTRVEIHGGPQDSITDFIDVARNDTGNATQVVSSRGETMQLAYEPGHDGPRLTSIRDPYGKSWTFDPVSPTDDRIHLVNMPGVDGQTTGEVVELVEYEDSHLLKSIRMPDNTITTYHRFPDGKVEKANIGIFDPLTGSIDETNLNATTFGYECHDDGTRVVRFEYSYGQHQFVMLTPLPSISPTARRMTWADDPQNCGTDFHYDLNTGNLFELIDISSQSGVRYFYDADNGQLKVTERVGSDGARRLTEVLEFQSDGFLPIHWVDFVTESEFEAQYDTLDRLTSLTRIAAEVENIEVITRRPSKVFPGGTDVMVAVNGVLQGSIVLDEHDLLFEEWMGAVGTGRPILKIERDFDGVPNDISNPTFGDAMALGNASPERIKQQAQVNWYPVPFNEQVNRWGEATESDDGFVTRTMSYNAIGQPIESQVSTCGEVRRTTAVRWAPGSQLQDVRSGSTAANTELQAFLNPPAGSANPGQGEMCR
jgi:hypothetical protein